MGKKTGKTGTVIGIVICILLIPILAMNIIMIIEGAVRPDKVPSIAGYSPLIVMSDSMYPGIESGDLVIVHTAGAENVKTGDVISFFDPDSKRHAVVTHRVAEVVNQDNSLYFRTKGDANNADDASLVPASSLVGVYVRKIAGAGNVALFLQSAPGLAVCIAVPLAIIVLLEIFYRKKYEKEQDVEKQALLQELAELKAKQKDVN